MLRGADPAALEEKIKKWYQDDEEDGEGDLRIKGHVWNHFVLFFSCCKAFTLHAMIFAEGSIIYSWPVLFFSLTWSSAHAHQFHSVGQ